MHSFEQQASQESASEKTVRELIAERETLMEEASRLYSALAERPENAGPEVKLGSEEHVDFGIGEQIAEARTKLHLNLDQILDTIRRDKTQEIDNQNKDKSQEDWVNKQEHEGH